MKYLLLTLALVTVSGSMIEARPEAGTTPFGEKPMGKRFASREEVFEEIAKFSAEISTRCGSFR